MRHLVDRSLWIRFGILVFLLLIWDLVVRTGLVDKLFLPGPLSVASAIVDLSGDAQAREALLTTTRSIVFAFIGGVSVGGLVALSFSASRLLRDAFYPPLLLLLSTPKSIFLPILIMVFGVNPTSSAIYGAFQAFPYVVVSILGGLDLVQPGHLKVARAFRAGTVQKYVDVVFPASMPGIFAALWYGVHHAFIGVMIAELWASVGGIGGLIRAYAATLRTDYVLATVLTLSVGAILAGTMWTRLETVLSRWRAVDVITVSQPG